MPPLSVTTFTSSAPAPTLRRLLTLASGAALVSCNAFYPVIECVNADDCEAPAICRQGECVIEDAGASDAETGDAARRPDAADDPGVGDVAADSDDAAKDSDDAAVDSDGGFADSDDGDADAPNVDVPDLEDGDVGGEVDVLEPCEPQRCGGCAPLEVDGTPVAPGDACGPCGGGVVVCNGADAVRCAAPVPSTVCGSCGELPADPGATCGTCGAGAIVCRESGGVECVGVRNNRCGGCEPLAAVPGDPCAVASEIGIVVCASTDEVRCSVSATNACGGEGALLYREETAAPGDPCGCAGEGSLHCDGTGALACNIEHPENLCGGCATLEGVPGEACSLPAACAEGTWTCAMAGIEALGVAPFDGVVCVVVDRPPRNVCGGCDALEIGCEAYACLGPDAFRCEDAGAGDNPCGGTGPLTLGAAGVEVELGDRCGTCSSGSVVCAEDGGATCVDDLGDSAGNACGGCASLTWDGLPNGPDNRCGRCGSGTLVCGEDGEALECAGELSDEGLNACGGCGALVGELAAVCGTCASGALACADDGESLVCGGDRGVDALNACGLCGEEGLNPCGGCGALRYDAAPFEESVGGMCGVCADGAWTCLSENAVECVGASPLNACGGCSAALGSLGDRCGECGEWACEGTEILCDEPDNCD